MMLCPLWNCPTCKHDDFGGPGGGGGQSEGFLFCFCFLCVWVFLFCTKFWCGGFQQLVWCGRIGSILPGFPPHTHMLQTSPSQQANPVVLGHWCGVGPGGGGGGDTPGVTHLFMFCGRSHLFGCGQPLVVVGGPSIGLVWADVINVTVSPPHTCFASDPTWVQCPVPMVLGNRCAAGLGCVPYWLSEYSGGEVRASHLAPLQEVGSFGGLRGTRGVCFGVGWSRPKPPPLVRDIPPPCNGAGQDGCVLRLGG